jgi:hypothetical protein
LKKIMKEQLTEEQLEIITRLERAKEEGQRERLEGCMTECRSAGPSEEVITFEWKETPQFPITLV